MSTFKKIVNWGKKNDLYKASSVEKQFVKLGEEIGEVAGAIAKGKPEEVKKEIGDAVVVLTHLAEMHGFDIQDCIDVAYDKIKNRNLKMINGILVKEADWPENK